ncbi:uncharacterized protein B0H64DRAFT_474247 [Chaetomium fimeti]|jgi:hypothetical protein|uniref:Uncharacterized protein n=1 Tax=Chaetomium fimeti TaxID=1854472 RepID=A0AAE0HF57_9PEZI|nr:hypothetical protein B0H64DRAFT_474247 [Chaetomium fimeti]
MTRLALLLAAALPLLPLTLAEIQWCEYSAQICGYQLIEQYGATEQDLATILRSYSQPTDPSHIYDSVYTCFKQNSVGWVSWCGGPYTCEPTAGWPLARCK